MPKPLSSHSSLSTPTSDSGFAYSRPFFESLADIALAHAGKLGGTDAGVEVSEGCGLSVSVRNGELENVERNRDKSLGVTVYVGHKRGNASTSDFSPAAIAQTVRAAYDIARFTAEDTFASLPDEADIAPVADRSRALDLFHPWAVTSEQAAKLALECEAAALSVDKRITNSEGAAVSAQQSQFFSAHTHGFRGGYASSRHSLSVSPIAGKGDDMQRDAWYSSQRKASDLASAQAVGRYAAERALSRLKSRKISTRECPVLFESPLAAGLLGTFVQAVSGGSLYRKSSFLLDSLGKQVPFPSRLGKPSEYAKMVEAIYSSMQAGEVIASAPQVAPVADEIMKAGGYQVPTPAGVDPNFPQPASPMQSVGMQAAAAGPVDIPESGNTSPMFPANPGSPAAGDDQGIESDRM